GAGVSALNGRRIRGDDLLPVIAVRAVLDVPLALGLLLQEIRRGALRAGAGDGAVVDRKVALGVAGAGEEDAPARAPLDEIAFLAVRALHARRLRRCSLAAADLPDVLAVRIAGAAEERTVA